MKTKLGTEKAVLQWAEDITTGDRRRWHRDKHETAAYIARAVRIAEAWDTWEVREAAGDYANLSAAHFDLEHTLCKAAEGEDK